MNNWDWGRILIWVLCIFTGLVFLLIGLLVQRDQEVLHDGMEDCMLDGMADCKGMGGEYYYNYRGSDMCHKGGKVIKIYNCNDNFNSK